MKKGISYKVYFNLITVIIILLLVVSSSGNTYAINDEKNYYYINYSTNITLDDIVFKYEFASPTYRKIEIDNKLLSMQYDILQKQVGDLNNQIIEYNKLIDESNKLIETQEQLSVSAETEEERIIIANQITQLQTTIEQYKSALLQFVKNKDELEYQMNESKFYKDYYSKIIEQEQEKTLINFRKKCLEMITNKEEKDYLDAYKNYIDTALKIEKIKLTKGTTTSTKVSEIENELNSIYMQIQRNTNDKQKLEEYIKREIRQDTYLNYKIDLSEISNKISFSKDIKDKFKNNDLEKIRISSSISNKEKYINLITDNQQKEIEKIKLQQLQLEQLQHTNQMEEYLLNLEYDYNYYYDLILIEKNNLELMKKKCLELTALKNAGKATELEYNKVLMEKEKKEMEYYNSVCNYLIYNNIVRKSIPTNTN